MLASRRLWSIGLLTLSLTACGFQLRGPRPLQFERIFLEMNPYDELTSDLKRQIRATGSTTVSNSAEEADVRLQVAQNARDEQILSLAADGTVREYRLRHRFAFRLQNRSGQEVMSLSEVIVTRDLSFNSRDALAKESEKQFLFRDMQNDLVQQIMRRLAAVKPLSAKPPESAPNSPAPK